VSYPMMESFAGEGSTSACLESNYKRQQNSQTRGCEKVTNIICPSVLLDMSTPDRKRVAESLDSWRNWSSASMNSCFFVWTRGKFVSGGNTGSLLGLERD